MDVQDLVNLALGSQGATTWDVPSLIKIAGVLAVKVNGVVALSGSAKEALVLSALKKVLEVEKEKELAAPGLTEDVTKDIKVRYDSLLHAVDTVIPVTLQMAVSAANGKLNLKKVPLSYWANLCSCCAKTAVAVLVNEKVITEEQAEKAGAAIAVAESVVTPMAKAVDSGESATAVAKTVAEAAAMDVAAALASGASVTSAVEDGLVQAAATVAVTDLSGAAVAPSS
jgi:hypothetical protein